MSEWKYEPLDGLANVILGQSPPSGTYNEEEEGLPFLQGSAEFGAFHPVPRLYCSEPLRITPQGGILMSVRAPVGNMNIADRDYCIGRGLCGIVGTKAVTPFLRQLLDLHQAGLNRLAQGSTFTAISGSELKGYLLKVPDPTTQRTIARILGTVDGLIERTEALIAKQQQIKQGLLHDLFTRGVDDHGALRPPHSEAPELYHETVLGWLPKGWRVDSLSAGLELLTDYEANGSFEHVKLNVRVYDEPNYAWYVRATDLEQKLGLDKVRYVDKASYEFLTKTTLHGGEVTVTKRGEIGKVYRVPYAPLPITLAPNMYLLRLNDRLDPNYLFHYFKSSQGQHELLRNNASTTLGALYKDDVKAMRVPFAPNDEQTEIAWRIDLFERSIENELMQAEKYRAIKSGLMQDLLTGRVSVEELADGVVNN